MPYYIDVACLRPNAVHGRVLEVHHEALERLSARIENDDKDWTSITSGIRVPAVGYREKISRYLKEFEHTRRKPGSSDQTLIDPMYVVSALAGPTSRVPYS